MNKLFDKVLQYALPVCAIVLTITLFYVIQTSKPNLKFTAPTYELGYPTDTEITFTFNNITVTQKVSQSTSNNETIYTYFYRIKYVGTEKYYFNWEILDYLLTDITISEDVPQNKPRLIALIPNQIREFSIVSNTPPALYQGPAVIYKPLELKDKSIVWDPVRIGQQPGPLPKKN